MALERFGLYRQMLRLRMVEDRIALLRKQGELACPVNLARGWEAVAVGVCYHLERADAVLANRRSIAPYLARGGDLERLLAELQGRRTGCCGGRGGAAHLVDLEAGFLGATPLAGAGMAIATGHALAASQRGEDRVTACFLDEVAVESAAFHESLAFAAARRLPILFICQAGSGQPSAWRLACAHGLDSAAGDGRDVLAVESLANEAVARARAGSGPSFLEFSIPAPLSAERASAPGRDLEGSLLAAGLLTSAAAATARAEIAIEIERALAFARLSPWPSLDRLLDHVHAEVPGVLVELLG